MDALLFLLLMIPQQMSKISCLKLSHLRFCLQPILTKWWLTHVLASNLKGWHSQLLQESTKLIFQQIWITQEHMKFMIIYICKFMAHPFKNWKSTLLLLSKMNPTSFGSKWHQQRPLERKISLLSKFPPKAQMVQPISSLMI